MNRGKKIKVKRYKWRTEKQKRRLMYLTIFSVILVGAVYQLLGIYSNADKLGRVGSLIEVNGVNMHLYTAGNGDVPVVFTANIGATVPYVETYPLHSKLAETTSIAVYDKPGYGWSDCTKASRDIDTIVSEVHTLLEKSNIDKPFILVAQGMGSFEVLRYAQLYPEDVDGIVLIDGASPKFGADFNNIMIIEAFMINASRNVGLLRLASGTDYVKSTLSLNPDLAPNLTDLNIGIGLEKVWNRNIIAEKLKVPDNAQKIIDFGDIGDIPLRVITSKANPYSNWNRSQSSLSSLSTNFKQYFIEGSVDYIEEKDVPEILEVINSLIEEIKIARDEI